MNEALQLQQEADRCYRVAMRLQNPETAEKMKKLGDDFATRARDLEWSACTILQAQIAACRRQKAFER